MSQSFRHDHPTTCALVSELHTLEHRVEEWAEAKPRSPAEVNAVVATAIRRIERAALIGSVNEPESV